MAYVAQMDEEVPRVGYSVDVDSNRIHDRGTEQQANRHVELVVRPVCGVRGVWRVGGQDLVGAQGTEFIQYISSPCHYVVAVQFGLNICLV